MNFEVLKSLTKERSDEILLDTAADWVMASELGLSIVEACPTLLIGHLILCRASRHVGDLKLWQHELQTCLGILKDPNCFEQDLRPEVTKELALSDEWAGNHGTPSTAPEN